MAKQRAKSKPKREVGEQETHVADTRKEPTFSEADMRKADEQGWRIFETDARGLEIERVDEYGVFEDDNQAEDYVIRQAARGDKTAQKALKIVSAIRVYHVKVNLAINLPYPILSKDWDKALWQAIQERVAAGDEHDVKECVVLEDVTLAERLEED